MRTLTIVPLVCEDEEWVSAVRPFAVDLNPRLVEATWAEDGTTFLRMASGKLYAVAMPLSDLHAALNAVQA